MKHLPAINARFWILLISATTFGETAGDLFAQTLGFGYGASTVALIALFIVALAIQVTSRKPHASLYWLVILFTSTAGTTLSDYVTRSLNLGYGLGCLLLFSLLVLTFVGWRANEKSVSTENIPSKKVECLYWAAILLSSTLGTAFGDFLADESGLSFGGATLVLAVLLALIAVAALYTKISRVLCFWAAIVGTHPIGATLGDYLTKKQSLNLGTYTGTGILLGIFALVILYNRMVPARPKQ